MNRCDGAACNSDDTTQTAAEDLPRARMETGRASTMALKHQPLNRSNLNWPGGAFFASIRTIGLQRRSLEAKWNVKLRALAEAELNYDRQRQADQFKISASQARASSCFGYRFFATLERE
jgi:hypothetical protein